MQQLESSLLKSFVELWQVQNKLLYAEKYLEWLHLNRGAAGLGPKLLSHLRISMSGKILPNRCLTCCAYKHLLLRFFSSYIVLKAP